VRHELKQAAAQRLGSVPARARQPASEIERILLRALVRPETDLAREVAAEQLSLNPHWYEGLAAASLFDALACAPCPSNPLVAAPDDAARDLLAHTLNEADQGETAPPGSRRPTLEEQVRDALHTLEHRHLERRQRELRTLIAEADRRGDQPMLTQLIAEKLRIDRKLRDR